MATYMQKPDKRNTSSGVTPNKAIRRPASTKKMPKRPQGR